MWVTRILGFLVMNCWLHKDKGMNPYMKKTRLRAGKWLYAKQPGFTSFKDSIQPQKMWNFYNTKHIPISNFHIMPGHLR